MTLEKWVQFPYTNPYVQLANLEVMTKMEKQIIISEEELKQIKNILNIVSRDYQRDELRKRVTQITKEQYQTINDFHKEYNKII